MKRIIAVLIALLVLSLLIPTNLGMAPLLVGSPKNMTISDSPRYIGDPGYMNIYTTPSLSAFLNDSWIPGMRINYTSGSMFNPYNIYPSGILDTPKSFGSIIGFMAENNTTLTAPYTIPLHSYRPIPLFKKHQLN
ncbi:MAG: hypothetical protein LUQ38_04470 [Methanotrichaceae archaeon]|nr:hypothetical protein [Methanotrichaceae archaeon]